MSPQQVPRDHEINHFAIWFGKVLVGLKEHDLKLDRQPREHSSYAKSPAREKILSIRPSVLK